MENRMKNEKKLYVFQIETKQFELSDENLIEVQKILATALKSKEPYTIVMPDKINVSVIRASLGELKKRNQTPELQKKYINYIQLLDNIKSIRVKEFTMHMDPPVQEEPDYENLMDISISRIKSASKGLNIVMGVIKHEKEDGYEISIGKAKTSNCLDVRSVYNVGYVLDLVSGTIDAQAMNVRKEFEGMLIPKTTADINTWLASEGLVGISQNPQQLQKILKMIGIKKFIMNHLYGEENK